jgi:hypothetical protein
MPTILIDTMLLTLFVVGTASSDYIEKHKRLRSRSYTRIDFDLLVANVSRASAIIVTPNTLTETSNWAKMIKEPARSRIAATLQDFVGRFDERYVASNVAALDIYFPRLWLTDSAILQELTNGHVLLTSDSQLYIAALQRGFTAINFEDLRGL